MAPTDPSRVILLFGGYWVEREISIASAQRVAQALRGSSLRVTPVRWDSDGWIILADDEPNFGVPGLGSSPPEVLADLANDGIGVVVNCLHGGPGADGSVQGLLEVAGLPYTGAGVMGSVAVANRHLFRALAAALGCEIAPGAVVQREAWRETAREILPNLSVEVGLPALVKPVRTGSPFGTVKAEDAGELEQALESYLESEREVLVEQFVTGREIAIPVLGTRVGMPPQVLPAAEIETIAEPAAGTAGTGTVISLARGTVPAQIDDDTARYLSGQCALLHRALELGGASVTEVVLGADGPIFVESSTQPFLAPGALLPECAGAAGLDFTALCRRLIDYSLSAHLARSADTHFDSRA